MSLFQELSWRGLVNQTTHAELPEILERGPLTVYCGFDPSADSLHIGSLLPLLHLMRFERAGHRPIALIGGATGLIGDPSGKTAERRLQTREDVDANVAGIHEQLSRFLNFDKAGGAVLVNNIDWLGKLPLVDFLRDVGKHFSVNNMLMKESVKQRIADREHGISYTEFSYSLLQAYDFLHLHDEFGCTLQVGGSDQWGNIVAGIDLIRRLRDAQAYGLTFPLVTKSDGAKFGKTEEGNVWLSSARTSPYRFYQFWINQADDDAGRYLRYFTFLSQEEVEAIENEHAAAPHTRVAQKRLAEEVTRMVHGDEALENAQRASSAMFGGELAGLDDATLEDIFSEVPSIERPKSELGEGRPLLDVLVESGVFASKGEGRRMIESGGVYINNERIGASDALLTESALSSSRIAVVRKGKKNYFLLKFV